MPWQSYREEGKGKEIPTELGISCPPLSPAQQQSVTPKGQFAILPRLVRAAFHPNCLDSVYGQRNKLCKNPSKPEIGKRNGTRAFEELWRLLAAAQEWLRELFQLLSSRWLGSHCPQSLCPHLHPDPPSPSCCLTDPHHLSFLLNLFAFPLNTIFLCLILSQRQLCHLKNNKDKKKKKPIGAGPSFQIPLGVVLVWINVSGGCCCELGAGKG